MQVNVGSLFGEYRPGSEELAWQLIENGVADLISTDHHADHRVASPRAAFLKVAERASEDVARILLSENTRRVLADQPLMPVPSVSLR